MVNRELFTFRVVCGGPGWYAPMSDEELNLCLRVMLEIAPLESWPAAYKERLVGLASEVIVSGLT